jgi:hypothetical protein
MSIFSIPSIVRDGASTLRKWKQFKQQTGEWPVISIAASVFGITAFVAAGGFLIWYSGEHHWSNSVFALVLIAFGLPFALTWGWIQDKIHLAETRRAREHRKIVR